MSFVVYLAVILVAAASAVFGLDLLTAPLPPKPPAQVASTGTPNKVSQREAQKQQADKQANNRALSPIFPTNPAESKDVHMVHPPTMGTTGASRADAAGVSTPPQAEATPAAQAAVSPQPPPQPQESPQPAQPAASQATAAAPAQPAEPDDKTDSQHATTAAPATEPVAQQSGGRCDVQACTSRYLSFRASDCTYQPFSGPRRVCSAPSAHRRATVTTRTRAFDARAERVTRDWNARRNPELDDAVRGVRQLPDPYDDDDANSYQPRGGRRTIVIERGGGFWR